MSTYISNTFNTSNDFIKFRLVVDVLSQDIINNRSQIRRRLQAWRTNTGFTTFGTGTAFMRTDYGTATTQGITSSQTITFNSFTVLYDDTVWINHNGDGSRVVHIGGYFVINSVVSSSMSDFAVSLPSIPRESTATATNADIESATSININRFLSTYTTSLSYTFGALSGTIATKTPNTSVGWTVPSSFYAQIPNSISGVGTIWVDTYSGDTLIGTTSTTFTATVNATLNRPNVSATISDSNTLTNALTGNNQNFVRFISNAVFNITSTPKNSATIVSRSIVCGAKSSTSASGTLTEIETATFTVTTTDSRGLSNSVTYTKTLVDYVKLTLNPTISRTSPTGDTFNFIINGNYFNSSFGSESNTLKVEYRVSEDGGTTYTTWTEITGITPSGNAYSKTGTTITGFDYTKQAIFQIRTIDKIYTVSTPILRELIIARGIPVFNYGDTFFRHNTDVYFGSKELIDLTYPVGAIYMSVVSTSPATLFGGTWAVWGTGRVPVGVNTADADFDTVEETGGAKTHTLTIPEMPSHTHIVGGGTTAGTTYQKAHTASGTTDNATATNIGLAHATGGGLAHNNLQPYITCFMWKRTA